MKERPSPPFSGEEVRTILDTGEIEFRRAIKNPERLQGLMMEGEAAEWCPFGRPGTKLWVREAFDIVDDPAATLPDEESPNPIGPFGAYECAPAVRRGPNNERWVVDYAADQPTRIIDKAGKRKWRSPMHMPRWASRIVLEIVAVRVEKRDVWEWVTKAKRIK